MADISNKTIVSLLLVVTVVTVVGTVFSVSRMDSFVNQWAGFTGGATSGTGYINFTTGTNVAVTVSGNIDFGEGYVNSSTSFANMSSKVAYTAETGWINTSGTSWAVETNITINNTGNTVANLTFSANESVAVWIGGPYADADARMDFDEREAGSCTGTLASAFNIQPNVTEQNVCTSATRGLGFNFTDVSDEIASYVNLLLPGQVPTGQRSTTLTFTVTSNQ